MYEETIKPLELHKDTALEEILLQLLETESIYGNEERLCSLLQASINRLLRNPERIIRIGNNLVVASRDVTTSPTPGRQIALLGHLDTVAPSVGELRKPAYREGDRICGLGASDMKSGLAVMLALLAAFPDDAPTMVFYDKEEGSYAGSGLEVVLDRLPWLRRINLGLLLEPTDNTVQLGCLGNIHAQVDFLGRSCHSARPWLGDNPIYRATGFINRIAEMEPLDMDCSGLAFREVISITRAVAHSATLNVIPDRFSLNVNLRFSPHRTLVEAEKYLRSLLGQEDQDTVEVEIKDKSPAGRVPLDNPLVRLLLDTADQPPQAKQAWTDVARLSSHGVDAVCLGPGHAAQAHVAGEYVTASNMRDCFNLIRTFIQRL